MSCVLFILTCQVHVLTVPPTFAPITLSFSSQVRERKTREEELLALIESAKTRDTKMELEEEEAMSPEAWKAAL